MFSCVPANPPKMLALFCAKRNILAACAIAWLGIDPASLRRAQNACKCQDAGHEKEIEGKSIVEQHAERSENRAHEQRRKGEAAHKWERAKSRRLIG